MRKQFPFCDVLNRVQGASEAAAGGIVFGYAVVNGTYCLLGNAYRVHHRFELGGFQREGAVWSRFISRERKVLFNDPRTQGDGCYRNGYTKCVIGQTSWTDISMPRSKATVDLSKVVAHFETLEDPRSSINLLHPLPTVVTISLMAVLAHHGNAILSFADALFVNLDVTNALQISLFQTTLDSSLPNFKSRIPAQPQKGRCSLQAAPHEGTSIANASNINVNQECFSPQGDGDRVHATPLTVHSRNSSYPNRIDAHRIEMPPCPFMSMISRTTFRLAFLTHTTATTILEGNRHRL